MKARETGMSKARMRSTFGVGVPEDVLGLATSIAAAWVRWEMPTARVFVDVRTSPPPVWNWQSRRKRTGRHVLVVGVVLEDVLAGCKAGSAVAVTEYDAVEADASATTANGSRGEVEVGHRVDDQVGLGLGVDQGVEGRGRREGMSISALVMPAMVLTNSRLSSMESSFSRRSGGRAGRGCRPRRCTGR